MIIVFLDEIGRKITTDYSASAVPLFDEIVSVDGAIYHVKNRMWHLAPKAANRAELAVTITLIPGWPESEK